ncbi:MAG: DUF805 domain-containing protein [Methylococcaceae bacterium]|nr:DUF805 domain-containing protein [Methylococcaceae bacterium]
MNWYLKVVTQDYANFSGRARRKEYWMFVLFNLIFTVVAMGIDNVLGITFTMEMEGMSIDMGYGWIYLLYTLAILIPGLAVTFRRLHDRSKSGWFIFIVLIPLIGAIWFLVVMCSDSDAGANNYGESPK